VADLDTLQLGTRVRFKRPLRRVIDVATSANRKAWEADPYRPGKYGGIVVGLRTLSDGRVVDWGGTYRPERHFRAVLVAEGLHRRPVFVLPEDVEVAR
jgi:hypothetical protein